MALLLVVLVGYCILKLFGTVARTASEQFALDSLPRQGAYRVVMDLHVLIQIKPSKEAATALPTAKGLHTLVQLLVSNQVTNLHKLSNNPHLLK